MEAKQTVVKSYPCKTKESSARVENFWKPAIQEYVALYNKVSLWLANNITAYTLGQVADILVKSKTADPKSKIKNPEEVSYIKKLRANSDWKLYQVFKEKTFSGHDRENVLFDLVNAFNIDKYKDNILGIASTYYRTWGYIKSVAGNYSSKFSSIKISLHRKAITSDSTFDEMTEQYIYESMDKKKSSLSEWENYICYMKDNDFSPEYIGRMETLVDFYRANKESVDNKKEELIVEQLTEFFKVGCQRKTDKLSMTLIFNNGYKWAQIENTNNFHLVLNKEIEMDVWGRKDLVQNQELLVNLDQCTQSIGLSIKNGELWVTPSFNTELKKPVSVEEPSNDNTVGVDVNTKHALMFTSIIDNGQVEGYVNLYKEFLKDKDIVSLSKEIGLYNVWKDHAQYVTFAPIECDLILGLYERMKEEIDNKYAHWKSIQCGRLGDLIYNKLKELRRDEPDVYKRDYISRVILLRTEIRAYLSSYFQKMERQSEYDKSFTNQDELKKNPFRNTPEGIRIIGQMRSIQSKLLSNRNNIICYAYKVLQNNGFKYLSLECLESSQMERSQKIPTPQSMLDNANEGKTALRGLSLAEIEKDARYIKFKDYYDFHFTDGKVSDCFYNPKGWRICRRSHLNNIILKAIHFADFKDKFLQLSNNGKIQITLNNSAYTSQLDSASNSIYIVEYKDENGKSKTRIATKQEVRPNQEYHINGLNADFNAACNIRNRITFPPIRELLMKRNKNAAGYKEPLFNPVSPKIEKVIMAMKKINRTITIQGLNN